MVFISAGEIYGRSNPVSIFEANIAQSRGNLIEIERGRDIGTYCVAGGGCPHAVTSGTDDSSLITVTTANKAICIKSVKQNRMYKMTPCQTNGDRKRIPGIDVCCDGMSAPLSARFSLPPDKMLKRGTLPCQDMIVGFVRSAEDH